VSFALSTPYVLDLSTADQTPFLFISNESAKDSDWPLTHPNKSTSEVIAVVKSNLFDKWTNTSHEEREKDEEYLSLKQKLTDSYLEAFYLHFPMAKGHVVFTCLGTPLTMNKFLGRTHGEVYALDHDVSRFDGADVQRALHPQTCIENLFLTGEDAFVVSVTACMLSGFVTAARSSWGCWFSVPPTLLTLIIGIPQVFFH
jgi:phytoene dehydrogenase-like protein